MNFNKRKIFMIVLMLLLSSTACNKKTTDIEELSLEYEIEDIPDKFVSKSINY